MRTYDKLIATICTSQGIGSLRSSFGFAQASATVVAPYAYAAAQESR